MVAVQVVFSWLGCPKFAESKAHSNLVLQYGEFRSGYGRDKTDTRLVFHGMRYLVENYLSRHVSSFLDICKK